MRVLMVSKACLVGSYQTKLEAIARHKGIELTVIVPPFWDEQSGRVELEEEHTKGYRLIVDPIRWNGRFHFFYFPNLRRRIAEINPDILHMDEEPYNMATWLGFHHAYRRGVKSLFFSWQNISRPYPPPFRWFERWVLKRADYAIMGNQAAVEVWKGKGYRGHYAVIPQFGVPTDLFHPSPTKKAGDTLVIGSANRRVVPEKGVDLLLQAVTRLKGNWRLRIAGEGAGQTDLVALAKGLGIEDRVEFVGAVSSCKMPAFLQSLDMLVLASRTLPNWKEQFGRVLVESMACGAVVVGSDSGEIPHVIGSAGLVFPEGDVAALAERLQRLMDSAELRNKLSVAGINRARSNYTQAQIAAQTVAVYRDMMTTP